MDNSQEAELQRRVKTQCEKRYRKLPFGCLPIKSVITIRPLPGTEEKKDGV